MRFHSWTIILTACVLSSAIGCDKSSSKGGGVTGDPHEARVTVDNPQPESKLTTVTLSDTARSHLDIHTVAVQRVPIPEFRTYGGEFVIPEGRSIILSAPLSGTIVTPNSGRLPTPGDAVSAGDSLFDLMPSLRGHGEVLNPSDRIALARARADLEAARVQAAGDVDSANVQVNVTQIALDRAEKLVSENAGSVRSLDEAKAAHRLAKTALEAATARKKVLDETMAQLEGDTGGTSLTITAPFSGIVQRMFVASAEVIAGGAQLCVISALDPLWVRASVYVGDLHSLSLDAPANARILGTPASETHALNTIAAPPTANSATSTVDLYYEIPNPTGAFQAGGRLIVSIPAIGKSQQLTIPSSAVVYDIHGGAWVYLANEGNVFERRRIAIRRIVDGTAVVSSGVDEGDSVVTTGAAELFGVEFGTAGH